eukprot:11719799-Prorocentrum_lima.AAC.1
MTSSLVGSEMCIRDRVRRRRRPPRLQQPLRPPSRQPPALALRWTGSARSCLLYTSDAADDM